MMTIRRMIAITSGRWTVMIDYKNCRKNNRMKKNWMGRLLGRKEFIK
jgi:hypothetical protein